MAKDARDKLVADMRRDIDEWYRHGRRNNLGDIACIVAIVVVSLAATVLAGTHHGATALVATMAALPAAVTALQRAVDFRGRSSWYFFAGARMRALMFELEHAEAPNLEAFARKRGALEVELEKGWGKLLGEARTG